MTLTDWTAIAVLFGVLGFAGPPFYFVYTLSKKDKEEQKNS